jgi:hypothetical protein
MNKLKKSLIGSGMAKATQELSSMQHYGSQATLMHMKQCEAREWIKRYRDKAREVGAEQANQWWRKQIADIERIRGLDEAIELRNLMNLERKK